MARPVLADRKSVASRPRLARPPDFFTIWSARERIARIQHTVIAAMAAMTYREDDPSADEVMAGVQEMLRSAYHELSWLLAHVAGALDHLPAPSRDELLKAQERGLRLTTRALEDAEEAPGRGVTA